MINSIYFIFVLGDFPIHFIHTRTKIVDNLCTRVHLHGNGQTLMSSEIEVRQYLYSKIYTKNKSKSIISRSISLKILNHCLGSDLNQYLAKVI